MDKNTKPIEKEYLSRQFYNYNKYKDIELTEKFSLKQNNISVDTNYFKLQNDLPEDNNGNTSKLSFVVAETRHTNDYLRANSSGGLSWTSPINHTSVSAISPSSNLITANTLYNFSGSDNISKVGTIRSGIWQGGSIDAPSLAVLKDEEIPGSGTIQTDNLIVNNFFATKSNEKKITIETNLELENNLLFANSGNISGCDTANIDTINCKDINASSFEIENVIKIDPSTVKIDRPTTIEKKATFNDQINALQMLENDKNNLEVYKANITSLNTTSLSVNTLSASNEAVFNKGITVQGNIIATKSGTSINAVNITTTNITVNGTAEFKNKVIFDQTVSFGSIEANEITSGHETTEMLEVKNTTGSATARVDVLQVLNTLFTGKRADENTAEAFFYYTSFDGDVRFSLTSKDYTAGEAEGSDEEEETNVEKSFVELSFTKFKEDAERGPIYTATSIAKILNPNGFVQKLN